MTTMCFNYIGKKSMYACSCNYPNRNSQLKQLPARKPLLVHRSAHRCIDCCTAASKAAWCTAASSTAALNAP
jgi:hypothetical protein